MPASGETYFSAAPDWPQTLDLRLSAHYDYKTRGIRVPLHESRTIDVRLFAARSRPDWSVMALDLTTRADAEPALKFEWNRATGNDGEILHVTIERTRASEFGWNQVAILSSDRANEPGRSHAWLGFVSN